MSKLSLKPWITAFTGCGCRICSRPLRDKIVKRDLKRSFKQKLKKEVEEEYEDYLDNPDPEV